MTENLFVAARKASGINQEQAAAICDVATGTYRCHERKPSDFRLGELKALNASYGEGASTILMRAVVSYLSK